MVPAGDMGGDGIHGFSRILVASDIELVDELSGDIGRLRSHDFFISGDLGVGSRNEVPLESGRGLVESLFRESDLPTLGVTGRLGSNCG